MPLNTNYYIVADTETNGLQPGHNEVIELAAVAIDPRSLSIVEGSEFCSLMRPLKPENIDKRAMEVNKKNIDEVMAAPSPKVVWENFCSYVNMFNKSKGRFKAPILVGHNIKFDLGFMNLLAQQYGGWDEKEQSISLFNFRTFDTMDLAFFWFENSNDLEKYKLDSLRQYTGYSLEESHSALPDVIFTAELFCRFLQLHRNFAPKVKFKNAFNTVTV